MESKMDSEQKIQNHPKIILLKLKKLQFQKNKNKNFKISMEYFRSINLKSQITSYTTNQSKIEGNTTFLTIKQKKVFLK